LLNVTAHFGILCEIKFQRAFYKSVPSNRKYEMMKDLVATGLLLPMHHGLGGRLSAGIPAYTSSHDWKPLLTTSS